MEKNCLNLKQKLELADHIRTNWESLYSKRSDTETGVAATAALGFKVTAGNIAGIRDGLGRGF